MPQTHDIAAAKAAPIALAERRSCAPQWRGFLDALSSSLPETAGEETALAVLTAVGTRMAESHRLPECATLEALEAAMNEVFESLDWGSLEIHETPTSVEFALSGHPCFGGVRGKALFAATVEGLLDAWMKGLADRPSLAVRLADHGAGEFPCLVYRYGRLGAAAGQS